MAYTKERARQIIKNNLLKIGHLEIILNKLRKNRGLLGRNILSERRSKITSEMLRQYNKQNQNSLAWMCKGVVNTKNEQRWMIETSTIFYFSKQLSNLKKKIHWMRQIAIPENQKRKKIYITLNGDWTAYFCFLLNVEIVKDRKDADYIFYKLDQNIKNIAECVNESNKIPTKIIACVEKENLGFLIKMLQNNGVSCFSDLDQTIDHISKL